MHNMMANMHCVPSLHKLLFNLSIKTHTLCHLKGSEYSIAQKFVDADVVNELVGISSLFISVL